MKIAIDWQLSSYFGWGVYGLNLALEWSDHKLGVEGSSIYPLDTRHLDLDPLRRRSIGPFLNRSFNPTPDDAVLLQATGNGFVNATGFTQRGKIAVAFFEEPLDPEAIERAKWYDAVVVGSSWNQRVLDDHGVASELVFQGIDPSLHHPAPRRGVFGDRFVVFSGGKAEPRKGQDTTLKAFRAFHSMYPDSVLVTAWHSPWRHLADGMNLDTRDLADAVVDVGRLSNTQMPFVYRECDVAAFPSRVEGGTNLVAMECIACDVHTLLSDCTGHQDLLADQWGTPLTTILDQFGRGEVPVDALVAGLEDARRDRSDREETPRSDAHLSDEWTWTKTASKLAKIST